jgi:pimeloyl-ACP methyl ester carboxylesterase
LIAEIVTSWILRKLKQQMNYLNVGGFPLWSYEWANNGEAVLLLHGGLSDTDSFADVMVAPLQDSFHLFAYDRAGHGRSADQPGSFYFNFQRDEAIAFITEVIKQPVHLIGYSDGANIALMVAIARPDLVKSIVSIAGNFSPDGIVDLPEFDPAGISDEFRAEYAEKSPDAPETLVAKIVKMNEIWKKEPNINLAEIAKISVPTLVLAGDDDVVIHSHSIELFEALPLGQLAIVPGTSHALVKEKPEIVATLINSFLSDQSYPITRYPIRRNNPT